MNDIKQLLEYIVSNIVNHPEDVQIETQDQGNDSIFFLINVNTEDTGRVIGKSGKVIRSIRQIVRIAGIRQNIHTRVDLKDDTQNSDSQAIIDPSSEENLPSVDADVSPADATPEEVPTQE